MSGHSRTRALAAAAAAAVTAVVALAIASVGTPAGAAANVGTGYWHTSGNQILDAANNPVRIAGINWYGFETSDEVVHGLWAQDYKSIIGTIKSLGYNTIRLPFSNQMVESPKVPANISNWDNGPINTDLPGLNALQVMDKVIAYAGQVGLKVILDNHRSEDGNSAESNGLWYTSAYPQTAWVNDWVALARRYQGNPTVVGMDLRNEPHTVSTYGDGATWGTGDTAHDWRLAAQTAGNAILGVNPNLLIIVEGISNWVTPSGTTVSDWWGGNLQPVASFPVGLNTANRLVYSAHDYGPHEFQQSWFNSNTTYNSLAAVWDTNFGYISKNNTAPVWVGEFGTGNGASDAASTTAGSQGQWFSSMVQYLKTNAAMGWTYWALNGEDSYALLDGQYDPTPVSAAKQSALAGIQFPLSITPPTGSPTPSTGGSASPSPSRSSSASASPSASRSPSGSPAPGSCRVTYARQSEWPGGFVTNVTLANTGTAAISGWTLAFTFPGDQKVTSFWSATVAQSGAAVTITPVSYNSTIAAGTSASFGFQGTWTTSDASPTTFTLNGTACTTG